MGPTALERIDNYLGNYCRRGKTPSLAYCLFDPDNIIKKTIYGSADIGKGVPADEHTCYRAYSATKTFTALSVMQLAEKGMVILDKPMQEYLPTFPYGSGITVRQVMGHIAGIPNPIPLNWIHTKKLHSEFDPDVFFEGIFQKHHRLQFKPGTRFQYSNLGYFLLGQMIKTVSGLPYERYIRLNIMDKLDLGASIIGYDLPEHLATGYIRRISLMNLLMGAFIDRSEYLRPPIKGWQPFTDFHMNGPAYAGLSGRPQAFVRYLQVLMQPESPLLGDSWKQQMLEEQLNRKQQGTGMSLGWFTGKLHGQRYYAHAGGGGGYYCELRFYPDLQLGSVLFFNRTGMRDERLLNQIDKFYLDSHGR